MRIGEHVLEGVPDPLPWRADMLHRADMFVGYADLNSQDPDVSQKALLKLCRNIRLYGLAFLRGKYAICLLCYGWGEWTTLSIRLSAA